MSQQTFEGDIGQVAGRDMVSHTSGPIQSNVININGAGMLPPEKYITELQCESIATKVQEVAQRSGVESTDVYRIILTEFGVNKIHELPKADYKPVMNMLKRWNKEEIGSVPEHDQALASIGDSAGHANPAVHIHTAPCQGCLGLTGELVLLKQQTRVMRIRAGGTLTLLFVVISALALAFFGGVIETKGITLGQGLCHFDGRAFSIGSVLAVAGSKTRECLPNTDRVGTHWGAVLLISPARP